MSRPLRSHLGALAVLLALTGFGRSASAHEKMPQHTIVVQADNERATILVTWVAGSEGMERLSARALWSRNSETGDRSLRTLVAQKALSKLQLRVDGKKIPVDKVESKITLDPNGTGRLAAAFLLTIDIPAGAHLLELDAGESTRIKWLDRSLGSVNSRVTPGRWQHRSHGLSLHWQRMRPLASTAPTSSSIAKANAAAPLQDR